MKLKTVVTVEHVRNGEVIAKETKENVTCNSGMAVVAQYIAGITSGGFTYIGVGVGTGTPAPTDTNITLGTTPIPFALASTSQSGATAIMTAGFNFTFSGGGTIYLTEAGLFNGPTNGVSAMLGHVTIGPAGGYAAVYGDALNITWNEVLVGA